MLVKPATNTPALGETWGIAVPTRYNAETHALFDTIMAVDSLLTPMLFGMSWRTIWVCRTLAGALLFLRNDNSDLSLRYELEIETAVGLALIVLGAQGNISRRLFERLYLIIGGGMMVANALMTQVPRDL